MLDDSANGAFDPDHTHACMLREIDGNELGKLFTKGMEDNSTREEFSKAINGVLRVADEVRLMKTVSWLYDQAKVEVA